LGSAPATTDSVSTGPAPVLVGDLLRREGRPPVPAARVAPRPEPEPDDEDQAVVPTPRSRGDACRTALGAGGLVVAGSVLGAALLAAAGVGGPLPFGQGGDDGAGQFQGEGTLLKPGTAYGSVHGRDVVARSGLLQAIAYYRPFGSTNHPAAGPGARAVGAPGARSAAGVVPVAGPPRPVQGLAPAAAVVPAGPAGGIGTSVVGGTVAHTAQPVTDAIAPVLGGVTHTAAPVLGGVSEAAAPVLGGVSEAAAPVLGTVTETTVPVLTEVTQTAAPAVGSVAQAASPIVATVVAPAATVISPLASDVAGAMTPVADLVGTTTAPVLETMTPVVEAATPLVKAAAPAVQAAGSVLDLADPLLPSLTGELTDPVVNQAGAVADGLPAAPASLAQAATGDAVSAVRDVAAGTTSAVQGAADAAGPVLSDDAAGTASRVVARAEPPGDLPTLPLPIVPLQATGSPQPAAADPPGMLTTIVPLQATDSPEPAANTPLPVLSSQGVDTPETPEVLTTQLARAEAEPPTEPLRIITPRDDPEPSAEPRTAPLRIVGPEQPDDTRADSEPDSDTPASRRTSAAEDLKDKASALLGR
jgi:hypothetical protein